METKHYSDYTLQELCELYTKTSQEGNTGEAHIIYEHILVKEKEEKGEAVILGSLWKRLGSAIIDGLIIGIPVILIMIFFVFPDMKFSFENFKEYSLYNFVIGQLLYLIINGYPLYNRGQSIGKIALDIKIVDLNNNKPSFVKIYLLRYLLNSLISLIPLLGAFYAFADAIFIFKDDRRCIHDYMAGTKVIVAKELALK